MPACVLSRCAEHLLQSLSINIVTQLRLYALACGSGNSKRDIHFHFEQAVKAITYTLLTMSVQQSSNLIKFDLGTHSSHLKRTTLDAMLADVSDNVSRRA